MCVGLGRPRRPIFTGETPASANLPLNRKVIFSGALPLGTSSLDGAYCCKTGILEGRILTLFSLPKASCGSGQKCRSVLLHLLPSRNSNFSLKLCFLLIFSQDYRSITKVKFMDEIFC